MNGALIRLELLLLIRSPVTLLLLVLVAGLSVGALASGAENSASRAEADTRFLENTREKETRFRDMLMDVEAGTEQSHYAGRPMAISHAAVLKNSVLGDFAVGVSDLLPSRVNVRLWENSASLFENYQFSNPTLLRLSGFDMTAMVILLMPLLMIALSFDALGSDRATGRIKLVLLSEPNERRYLIHRLAVRCGALWFVIILITLAAAIGYPGSIHSSRIAHYVAWMGGALLYGGFWFMIIAMVVQRVRAAGEAAGALIGLWAFLILIVPALTTAAVQAIYPAPSRLAYLTEVRAASSQADERQGQVMEEFAIANPQAHADSLSADAPFRDGFIRLSVVETATEAHRTHLDKVQTERAKAMAWLGLLSPAIAAEKLLTTVAGADAARYRIFQSDARVLLSKLAERLGPAIMQGERISMREYKALPKMTTRPEPLESARSTILTNIVILSLFVALSAFLWRSKRLTESE
ncbi:DUF3526 domain-containing protein [Parasphingorhabdus cellanae]|uniref:DUF3526 domain-containing protein n=1 Tax=Parasphingorhabdus cellanae TaxID=2806553 RepID=A0ABX7TAE0_9SPHN|nr:DUF3526 domain-containing protein [Parasphingorhabdus cellanae]QTD57178.1 DUF3526 domain-containing protein [Parasphingorhabdus cellanae]